MHPKQPTYPGKKYSIVLLLLFALCFTNAQAQVLQWSTYLGTTGDDQIAGMVKDNAGDIYVLGNTDANGFPVTAGAFQTGLSGTTKKLVISKLSGATGALLWSTYLGGDNDYIRTFKIYWDAVSNTININASSKANNFPIVNGNPRLPGATYTPMFIQLNPATGAVLLSTTVFNLPSIANGFGTDYRVLFDNGFAYYMSMDTTYKKLLVSKINMTTHQFVYQKSIKGNNGLFDHAFGLYSIGFTSDNGDVFVSGATSATDYPTTPGAYQTTYPFGAAQAYFLTRLDAAGNIGFSTYFNAAYVDQFGLFINSLACNATDVAMNGVFLDGIPVSPTGNPFDQIGTTNLGVAKFNRTNGSLNFFTYLGVNDDIFALRGCKFAGNDLIVTGRTQSPYMPITPNAIQPYVSYHINDGTYKSDNFFAHFDGSNRLVYSTYMGGNGDDQFNGEITVKGDDVYFAGFSSSNNFPTTANATQPVNKGSLSSNNAGEITLVKYNLSSRRVTYSSYLGTNVNEQLGYGSSEVGGITVSGDNIFINPSALHDAAHPLTVDFPISKDALQKTMIGATGGVNYNYHQYVAKINSVTGKLQYGGYIGALPGSASRGEYTRDLVLNGDDIFVCGSSFSGGYPVTSGAIGTVYKGNTDMYISKLSLCYTQLIKDTLVPANQSLCAHALVAKITGPAPLLANTPAYYRNGILQPSQQSQTNFAYQWQKSTDSITWVNINGATETDYQPEPVTVKHFFRRIAKPLFCENRDTSTVAIIDISSNVAFRPNAGGSDANFFACPGSNITLGTPATVGITYNWEPALYISRADTAQTVFNNTVPGAYTYVLFATSPNGCTAMDTATVYNYAANAGANKVLCQGKSTQIGGIPLAGLTGVSYTWTPATGLSCSNCATPVVSADGTYVLTVNVPLPAGGNCITRDTVIVTSSFLPDNPAGPDFTVCESTSVTLGTPRVAGYTYNWTPGIFLSLISDVDQPVYNQFNATIRPLYNPINYVLTASNNVGCTLTDTAKVYVVSADAGISGCRPKRIGMVDFTRGQATYQWVEVLNDNSEAPVGPGELSSTTVSNPIALVNNDITGPKSYRLKMTWNGVTCSADVTVGVACGGCPDMSLNFKSSTGCPNVTDEDSVTLYVMYPVPGYTYSWSPADGLNTTEGPIVKTGTRTSTIYTCTATSILDTSIHCIARIKVNQFGSSAPLFAAADKVLCKNNTAAIGLPPVTGLNYYWTSSSSNNSILYTSSSPEITAVEDISYYVYVEDPVSGCHAYDTVNIHVPAVLADAGPSRQSCTGGGFTLGTPAIPGLVYHWVPATGLDNADIAQPTVVSNDSNVVYILQVTDPSSGCNQVSVALVEHTNSPALAAMAAPLPYCEGSASTVQIGNTALSGVRYSWSPAANLSDPTIAQPTASPSQTTLYTVTASFGGACATTASASVTVTVTPKPTATATVVNNCESSQLDVVTNASSPSYYWSPATSLNSSSLPNPVSTAGIPTSYTVTVLDNVTYCNNTSTVDVVPPININAGGAKEFCAGSAGQIGTAALPNFTYSWSPAAGLNNAGIAQPTVLAGLAAGDYSFKLSATSGTCTKTDSVLVHINPTPAISLASGVTICKNAAVQIGVAAEPGTTYSWSPATGLSDASLPNPIASPLLTTAYSLTATNIITGCSATATTTVTVNTTGAPDISTAVSGNICPGGTVQLTAIPNTPGNYSYVWTPDINFVSSRFTSNPVVAPPATTTYQVLVTNAANGCSNTAAAIVTVRDTCTTVPVKWLAFTASLQNGKTLLNWTVAMEQNNKEFVVERSKDGVHWASLFAVKSLGNTALQRNYYGVDEAPANGINFYRIKQVDADGKASWSVVRSVKVGNASNAPIFIVYPNPAHDILNYELINGTNVISMSLALYAADGRLVKKIQVNNTSGSFSVHSLPAGVYVLTMMDNTGKMENRKVLVQK